VADVCLSVVLALHLLCMNVASAGPLVCVWLDWRWGKGDDAAGRALRFLADKSLTLLLVGGVLGLAVGWWLWSDEYHELLVAFAYKIRWGAWELLFSLVLMAVHVVLVRRSAAGFGLSVLRGTIAILAGTNLLYHFPPLFIVISEVASGAVEHPGEINAATFRMLMLQSPVLAKTLHVWLASAAVVGVSLVGYGDSLMSGASTHEAGWRMAAWGARLALVATVLQILVGVWLISVLPAAAQQRLLGGDLWAAATLGLSILVAFWLLHHLSAISLGGTQRKSRRLAVGLMLVVVCLMTMTSRRATSSPRVTTLQSLLEPDDVP